VVAGRPDLRIDFLTEEHGVGHVEMDGRAPEIGERLEIVPLHICSAVNLFDVAFGVRDGTVEHEFLIEARGKVR
jgi:D-serine deaminase-like pyridoxal phosphate-dependent protein